MSNPLAELITAVVSYVTERGGYITKTKLLKLLYLFEFYRADGKTCPHCRQQPYQMCNRRLYKSCIINVEEWQSG
jgi:hypothetical protein